MFIQKLKELEELKARAVKLEASIETERTAELAALPGQYGYGDINEFIKALKKAFEARGGGGETSAAGDKRTRVKITPEIKEQVKAATLEGQSGSAIAEKLGISLPSVQNIKKEFGLVKSRKTASPIAEADTPAVSDAPAPAADAPVAAAPDPVAS
ncbi:MAG: helix-turn-helix domain-containing protein [Opitutaceae bacterium]|jgi:hypothetical protein|nr:helix-turn-helix domain-containing protein [Opitutaceae bacterium]